MSYEPTVWKDGDLVTATKLNKLEQGVANGGGGGTFIFSESESSPSGSVFTTTFREIVDALEQGKIVIYRYKNYGIDGHIISLSDAILTEIAEGLNCWILRFLCYDLTSGEYTPINLMADDYDNPIKEYAG